MKNKILFSHIIMFLLICTSLVHAAFDGNYLFQLESATQTTIDAISTPQKGMMVYNTTTNQINYYDGIAWIVLHGNSMYNSDGQLDANRIVDLNTSTLTFTNGNIGIGNVTPTATLDVNGSLQVDGIYYDKLGNAGSQGQILTSATDGTEWAFSTLIPNITNDTINVAASSTVTITITGDNFIPTSIVTIPGFDGTINSTSVISPEEIQLNITTGAANTFDIVISNNGILNTQWAGNGVNLLEVN